MAWTGGIQKETDCCGYWLENSHFTWSISNRNWPCGPSKIYRCLHALKQTQPDQLKIQINDPACFE